jgi:hypothetical protein
MTTIIIVIWVFWIGVIGIMAFWRRSWIPLLVFPFILSGVALLLYHWSPGISLWSTVVFHGLLLTTIVCVSIFGRKEGDDPIFRRPPPVD